MACSLVFCSLYDDVEHVEFTLRVNKIECVCTRMYNTNRLHVDLSRATSAMSLQDFWTFHRAQSERVASLCIDTLLLTNKRHERATK
jgi:hypothetical protein